MNNKTETNYVHRVELFFSSPELRIYTNWVENREENIEFYLVLEKQPSELNTVGLAYARNSTHWEAHSSVSRTIVPTTPRNKHALWWYQPKHGTHWLAPVIAALAVVTMWPLQKTAVFIYIFSWFSFYLCQTNAIYMLNK